MAKKLKHSEEFLITSFSKALGDDRVLQRVIGTARRLAIRDGHKYISEWHCFTAVLIEYRRTAAVGHILRVLSRQDFTASLYRLVKKSNDRVVSHVTLGVNARRMICSAVVDAMWSGRSEIRPIDLIMFVLSRPCVSASALRLAGLKPRNLIGPVLKAAGEQDQGRLKVYYQRLHDLLTETRPKPKLGKRALGADSDRIKGDAN